MSSTNDAEGAGTRHLTREERRFGLIAVFAAGAIVTLLAGLTWPLLSLRLEAAGYGGAAIGASTAAQTVAMIVMAPLIPRLAARVGAVYLMLMAVATSVVVLLLMAAWENYASWLALRFVLGLCFEVLFLLSDAWVIQLAPEDRRGRIMGIYTAVSLLGFASGPLIIDFVGSQGAAPFLAGAVAITLATLPIWAARRQGPQAEGRTSKGFFGFLRATPTIMLAGAMYGFIDVIFLALFPVYAVRSGMTTEAVARLLSIALAGAIVCQYGIGWLCDRLPLRTMMIGCTLGAIGCAVVLPFAMTSFWTTVPVVVLWAGAMDGFFTIGMVMMGKRYRDIDLLGANSVFVVMFGIGSSLGPTIGGTAMDVWDPHGMVVVMALAGLLFLPFAARRDAAGGPDHAPSA